MYKSKETLKCEMKKKSIWEGKFNIFVDNINHKICTL